jgi:hypothetical protein
VSRVESYCLPAYAGLFRLLCPRYVAALAATIP